MEAQAPPHSTLATVRGLPRLELRVERLQLTFRFTFAFHAREVRFEIARGGGDSSASSPRPSRFHAARHDPTELFLQLDDLLRKPRSARAADDGAGRAQL